MPPPRPADEVEVDPDLRLLLESASPLEEDRYLEALAERLLPPMQGFLREKLRLYASEPIPYRRTARRGTEAVEEAMCRDAAPHLFTRLLALKARFREAAAEEPEWDQVPAPDTLAVELMRGMLEEHLRAEYPERRRVQGQVVYVLRRLEMHGEPAPLALWPTRWTLRGAAPAGAFGGEAERAPRWERVGGPAEWHGRPARRTRERELLAENPAAFLRARPELNPQECSLPELLEALCRWVRSPLEVDRLTGAVARLRVPQTDGGPAESSGDGPGPARDAGMEQGGLQPNGRERDPERLRRTWEALQAMPPHHRALLLLTGGGRGSLAGALLESGVVSLRRLAMAADLPALRLAELWPELPLSDHRFGELFEAPAARVEVWRFRARARLEAALAACK